MHCSSDSSLKARYKLPTCPTRNPLADSTFLAHLVALHFIAGFLFPRPPEASAEGPEKEINCPPGSIKCRNCGQRKHRKALARVLRDEYVAGKHKGWCAGNSRRHRLLMPASGYFGAVTRAGSRNISHPHSAGLPSPSSYRRVSSAAHSSSGLLLLFFSRCRLPGPRNIRVGWWCWETPVLPTLQRWIVLNG